MAHALIGQPVLLWAGRFALGVNVLALLAALALVVAPMVFPIQAFSVLSGSMQPTIPIGAVAVDQQVLASQLQPGDVITFEPPDRPGSRITHRIYSVTNDTNGLVIQTKGDGNSTPDPWQLHVHGRGWKYLFNVPLLGYAVVFSQSLFGRLALIVVPALLLLGLYFIDGRREAGRPGGV